MPRRVKKTPPGNFANPLRRFATTVLRGTGDTPQIGIGPVVWNIRPGADTRYWYFVACSIGTNRNLRIDGFTITDDDRQLAIRMRAQLMGELIARRKPALIVDFDDELEMARWAEALDPSERTAGIRRGLERQRATESSPASLLRTPRLDA